MHLKGCQPHIPTWFQLLHAVSSGKLLLQEALHINRRSMLHFVLAGTKQNRFKQTCACLYNLEAKNLLYCKHFFLIRRKSDTNQRGPDWTRSPATIGTTRH